LVRPYRVPFYPVLPVMYILVASVIIMFLGAEKPAETLWACLTLGVGIPLYVLVKYRTRQSGET
jgi:basic amino acid/polyamine antiporter, APA family